MMRRYAFLLLFLAVLVTPFVLRLAMGVSQAAQSRDANALPLVIITANVESARREFADAFSAWHAQKFGQRVYVDYRVYGAGDIVKYFDASRDTIFRTQGTYKVDLAWGGGDYLFEQQLKKPGYLEGVAIDAAIFHAAFPKPDLNGVPLYDVASNPPQWYGTALSSFGIAFNRDVDRYLKRPDPSTWNDLADPAYRGWIVAADPTRSASAKQSFLAIVEKAMADASAAGEREDLGWARGMGRIRRIAANARLFTDSASAVPGIISSGDAAAGMAIDFYGRSQAEAVGSQLMGYVEPKGATVISPDPIALVRGAEHRELAVRFIEFVLSDQGQRLWNTRAGAPGGPRQSSLRRLAISPAVYGDMSNFTDPVNPYTAAGGFNKSPAREKTFGIIGELIQASCIDPLDDLRETRRIILASPRAAELDAKLGMFPFDQKEALSRGAKYRAASAIDRLAMMRNWTAEFRAEYRRLREEAVAP
ncbi:MAG TPA: extracellular solute-binding protein [Tepidisphaeraceae bacterium]|nr:extracellular solute-binding protein [Tepidisphaeraceae bacterium]